MNSEAFSALSELAQQIPVGGTVVKLDNLDENVTHVFIQFQGAVIRATYDGSTPTATRGVRYNPDSSVTLNRQMAGAVRFIREGGTDGAIHVQPLQR